VTPPPRGEAGTTALLLALCSPVLSGVALLGLSLARIALAPLPRPLAALVLLPQVAAALLALRTPMAPRARWALLAAATMALLFGLRTLDHALAWACTPGTTPKGSQVAP
jgi:hypothetical protein